MTMFPGASSLPKLRRVETRGPSLPSAPPWRTRLSSASRMRLLSGDVSSGAVPAHTPPPPPTPTPTSFPLRTHFDPPSAVPSWYLGHMYRLMRSLPTLLRRRPPPLVIEARDARIPLSSVNPAFEELMRRCAPKHELGHDVRRAWWRRRLIVYLKADLVDASVHRPLSEALQRHEGISRMEQLRNEEEARELKRIQRLRSRDARDSQHPKSQGGEAAAPATDLVDTGSVDEGPHAAAPQDAPVARAPSSSALESTSLMDYGSEVLFVDTTNEAHLRRVLRWVHERAANYSLSPPAEAPALSSPQAPRSERTRKRSSSSSSSSSSRLFGAFRHTPTPDVGARLVIVGMPNVGKSSLLNGLRRAGTGKGKAVSTAPEPGHTRKLTGTVRITPDVPPTSADSPPPSSPSKASTTPVYAYDTPGVFLPYLGSDAERGLRLGLCSGLKSGLFDDVTLADYLLYRLNHAALERWRAKWGEAATAPPPRGDAVPRPPGADEGGGVEDRGRQGVEAEVLPAYLEPGALPLLPSFCASADERPADEPARITPAPPPPPPQLRGTDDIHALLHVLAERAPGTMLRGGVRDVARTARFFVQRWREGKLGPRDSLLDDVLSWDAAAPPDQRGTDGSSSRTSSPLVPSSLDAGEVARYEAGASRRRVKGGFMVDEVAIRRHFEQVRSGWEQGVGSSLGPARGAGRDARRVAEALMRKREEEAMLDEIVGGEAEGPDGVGAAGAKEGEDDGEKDGEGKDDEGEGDDEADHTDDEVPAEFLREIDSLPTTDEELGRGAVESGADAGGSAHDDATDSVGPDPPVSPWHDPSAERHALLSRRQTKLIERAQRNASRKLKQERKRKKREQAAEAGSKVGSQAAAKSERAAAAPSEPAASAARGKGKSPIGWEASGVSPASKRRSPSTNRPGVGTTPQRGRNNVGRKKGRRK